jgi:hypothetical protein
MWRFIKIKIRTIITHIMRLQNDEKYLAYLYSHRVGKKLNWDKPRRFTEKINVLKLQNKSDDLYKTYADKFLLRTRLKQLSLDAHLVPLINHYNDYSLFRADLLQKKIPKNTFVKLSNDCGSTILYNGCNAELVLSKIQKSIQNQQKFIHRTCEYQYQTPMKILVEANLNKGQLYDVKVFVSKGTVMQIMLSRGQDLLFCDGNLKPLNVSLRRSIRGSIHPTMPALPQTEHHKILSTIKIIAPKFQQFTFCRLDMVTNVSVPELYINEVTFSPSSGLKCYLPDSYDEQLGAMVAL